MSEDLKNTGNANWNAMIAENQYLNDLIENIQLRKKLRQLEKEMKEEQEKEKEGLKEDKQVNKKEILHG